MNTNLKRTLIWTPRVLGTLFILFVSLFALDIFDMNLGFWGTIVGLFMHLLPSIVMIIALVLAWKQHWEWAGAIGFIGFAVWYVTNLGGFDEYFVVFGGISTIIGLLFLIDWIYRKQLR
jgi:hypothetical protein